MFLAMLDMVPPPAVDLVRAADALNKLIERNRTPVLVCCAPGYERSAMVGSVLLFASAIWLGGYLSAVQVLLFAVLVYLYLRMDFDRRLFADFASSRLKPEDFDACRAANAAEMPHYTGAVKLLKKTAFFAIMQCPILPM